MTARAGVATVARARPSVYQLQNVQIVWTTSPQPGFMISEAAEAMVAALQSQSVSVVPVAGHSLGSGWVKIRAVLVRVECS